MKEIKKRAKGGGRKHKYGESTRTYCKRIPVSKYEEVKAYVLGVLKGCEK